VQILELGAEEELVMPYNKGAKKTRRAMRRRYGKKKGNRVFYATANKRGRGKSRTARVNNAYRKRRTTRKRRRR
jgi:hypothetical protein